MKTSNELQTIVYKSQSGGYRAESQTDADANGKAWQISTHKNSRGQVVCSAVQGQLNGDMFSYEMFGAKRLTLASQVGKCTEKLVKEVHAAGLVKFLTEVLTEESAKGPAYVVGVGQIIFTDGLENDRDRVVYEVESPGRFKTVLLDGSGFSFDEHVKPYSERFGIGAYYKEGEIMDAGAVAELVERARAAVNARNEEKKQIEERAARIRAEKLEIGRKLLPEIPAGVVAVIVAELHKDESDLQSDYHNYTTEDTVFLAWSRHDRDLFPEMRKGADKFEETNHLGTGKGIYTPFLRNASNNDFHFKGSLEYAGCELRHVRGVVPYEIPAFNTRAEAEQYISDNPPKVDFVTADDGRDVPVMWDIHEKEIEHREKYSMGAGYYLGHSKYSGWCVKKRSIDYVNLETLQIAAANGKLLCSLDDIKELPQAPNIEPVPVVAGAVNIIDYSEKAFAVVGDTKPIKDKLKEIGGSFNARLSCGPGWIFSKKRLEAVQKFLQNLSAVAA